MNRVYVEKRETFDLEALDMTKEIREYLKVKSLKSVRVLYRYDVEGLDKKQFELAVKEVFSQPISDLVHKEDYPLKANYILALEYLPGQYDQRSDFAQQCVNLLAPEVEVTVKYTKVLLFFGDLTQKEKDTIRDYYMNPIETREAGLELPETLTPVYKETDTVETIENFIKMDKAQLQVFKSEYSIGMDMEDLLFCQDYFKKENRNPTITEVRIFDTYWSDHCRHSTFLSVIDDIELVEGEFKEVYQEAIARYMKAKREIGQEDRPVCLMDIAVMGMKKLRQEGKLEDMEVSEEVNACSVYADVTVDGKTEPWVFMFKNETHNHPTEMEPFGGASTCLGGGIRDPLSGRAYVHGAIRLTGSGDPRTPFEDTLKGKHSQRKITRTAAEGYSSYSNQIGLASGHLSEVYDDGFVAKRMECGALVAAAPKEDIVRASPKEGDVIVLLGGDTGRDGLGGATGSSKEHDTTSLENGGAEVQKGNPAIERNIVRLFRNPVASRMIKKCNDFGAGGVSVCVCEIADSLEIDLDAVPLKYPDLDGTEVAISESQERMALLLDKNDLEKFMKLAQEENAQCVPIARVTNSKRVRMHWKGNTIVDISREMLDSGGVRKHTKVKVEAPNKEALKKVLSQGVLQEKNIKESWLKNLADLNVASKAAIANRFDFTSGGYTVLAPFGGKTMKTPEEGLVMQFPVRGGVCDTATLMTLGYNPKLGYFSPYHQAVYAVLESVFKMVALGADYKTIRLSFQEYYEKLGEDATKWGKPFAALLGAYTVQEELEIPSIGGKDSMSGTFEDIDVPPSLISFAVNTQKVKNIVSKEFKGVGNRVILVYSEINDKLLPDFTDVKKNLDMVYSLVKKGQVKASSSVGFGGIAAAVSTMAFGNNLGFSFKNEEDRSALFAPNYTALVLEVEQDTDLSGLTYRDLGEVTKGTEIEINGETVTLKEAVETWEDTLSEVFPDTALVTPSTEKVVFADYKGEVEKKTVEKREEVKVLIPIFPGSNGEYELEDTYKEAGAIVTSLVFRNGNPKEQEEAIVRLAKEIEQTDILAIPSGMSAGCEPDGSAKFIALVLKTQEVKKAVEDLLTRGGLVLGLGEGCTALVKTGLLPYGKYTDKTTIAVSKNKVNKYICAMAKVRVSSVKSPFMSALKVGDIATLPVSTQEGALYMDFETFHQLKEKGQIAAQYVDKAGIPTQDYPSNPFGASYAVEALSSPCGKVFGRFASFERVRKGSFINIEGVQTQNLCKASVDYLKK